MEGGPFLIAFALFFVGAFGNPEPQLFSVDPSSYHPNHRQPFPRHIIYLVPRAKLVRSSSPDAFYGPSPTPKVLVPVVLKPLDDGACRTRALPLPGSPPSIRACVAKKPIKFSKAFKSDKEVCGKGWQVCSKKDKGLGKLSWIPGKMPKGCYAFHYGKSKAAGYGSHCVANLYFDGILCCPTPGTKSDLSPAASSYHKLNYIDH